MSPDENPNLRPARLLLLRSRIFPTLLLALAMGWSIGCASTEREAVNLSPAAWDKALEKRGVDPQRIANPMAASEEMKKAAHSMAGAGESGEKLQRLQAGLFDKDSYTFEYDSGSTFTAQDAFANRRGNCVAFTNLFIALGRSLGYNLRAALLIRRGKSEKAGDLVMVYSHMVAAHLDGKKTSLYDFYNTRDNGSAEVRLLDDLSVAGISLSNRAIEDLRKGDLETAFVKMVDAVKLAPMLPSLRANLGLVRHRRGDLPGAFDEYKKGLELDAKNPSVLHNLAALYLELDRPADARAALASASNSQASTYLLMVRGDLELVNGDLKSALRHYEHAHRLDPKLVEPLMAIARLERARGRVSAARKALQRAAQIAPESPEVQSLLRDL